MLETERLVIRRFSPDDWHDLLEYLSLPEIYAFEPGEPIDAELAKSLAAERSSGLSFFACALKSSGKMIGHVYLGGDGPPEFSAYELGYIFNPLFQSEGYCTEASARVLDYAFSELGAHRVNAYCDPRNPASWHVLEKLRLKREGHFREKAFFRRDEKGEPLWHDCFAYGLLAGDWRSARS
jgi:Acetyltransferases, including N-acetylases of ribosomal proteins